MHIACGKEKLQKYDEEVKQFELSLEGRHRQLMQEEMRAYLEGKDREASQVVLKEGGYESRGLVKRTIMTGVGAVRVHLRRYRHRSGRMCYPLRDVCRIKGITSLARERCVRLAVERSYGWSAEVLKEYCGMEISRMHLWKIIQQEGAKEQSRLEQAQESIFSQARPVGESGVDKRPAVVELDGRTIRLVEHNDCKPGTC